MADSMQLNNLAATYGARPKAKRVGRGIGSGLGKTCGRGHKGYGSRSGSGIKRGFEGGQMPIQRRLPKIGFSSRTSLYAEQLPLHALAAFDGTTVTIDTLRQAGVIRKSTRSVKVYLKGELAAKVALEGIPASKGAREAIEKAGGSVTVEQPAKPTKLTKKVKTADAARKTSGKTKPKAAAARKEHSAQADTSDAS